MTASRPEKGPDAYRADLLTVVEHMMTRGAGVFLLGCTELPLAAEAVGLPVPVVDPTAELAKSRHPFLRLPCTGKNKQKTPTESLF